MGYSTDYKGVFKFKDELKSSELAHLNQFLGEDVRDHEEWQTDKLGKEIAEGNFYINICLADDFSGVMWNEDEKTNGMEDQINFLTAQMKKIKPDFAFEGEMMAQGEEWDDRYKIVISKGVAVKKSVIIKGRKVECPECEHVFLIDEEK